MRKLKERINDLEKEDSVNFIAFLNKKWLDIDDARQLRTALEAKFGIVSSVPKKTAALDSTLGHLANNPMLNKVAKNPTIESVPPLTPPPSPSSPAPAATTNGTNTSAAGKPLTKVKAQTVLKDSQATPEQVAEAISVLGLDHPAVIAREDQIKSERAQKVLRDTEANSEQIAEAISILGYNHPDVIARQNKAKETDKDDEYYSTDEETVSGNQGDAKTAEAAALEVELEVQCTAEAEAAQKEAAAVEAARMKAEQEAKAAEEATRRQQEETQKAAESARIKIEQDLREAEAARLKGEQEAQAAQKAAEAEARLKADREAQEREALVRRQQEEAQKATEDVRLKAEEAKAAEAAELARLRARPLPTPPGGNGGGGKPPTSNRNKVLGITAATAAIASILYPALKNKNKARSVRSIKVAQTVDAIIAELLSAVPGDFAKRLPVVLEANPDHKMLICQILCEKLEEMISTDPQVVTAKKAKIDMIAHHINKEVQAVTK